MTQAGFRNPKCWHTSQYTCCESCIALVQNPYWYKAITSEPCYWKGNIFLNNKDPFWGKLGRCRGPAVQEQPLLDAVHAVPLRDIGC